MAARTTYRRFFAGLAAGLLAGAAAGSLAHPFSTGMFFREIAAEAKAIPVISAGPAVFPGGVAAAVPVSLLPSPDPEAAAAAAVVVFQAAEPWMELVDVLPADSLAAAGKGLSFRLENGIARVALYGGDAPLPEGVLFHAVTRLQPGIPPGTAGGFAGLDGGSAADAGALPVPLAFEGPGVTLQEVGGQHAGDYVPDWRVSVSELLRLIQFYNTGTFHCAGGTEDGFAPGPGDGTCMPHDADYAPQDWSISLSELLRIIQFYNAGCYGPMADTEDGFAPCPFYPAS